MGYTLFFVLLFFTCYVLLVVFLSLKFKKKHIETTMPSNRSLSVNTPLNALRNDEISELSTSKAPLELQITNEIDRELNILRSETKILNPSEGDNYKFAFYMAVDGERQEVRWYDPNPKAEFKLPDRSEMVEITAFVMDDDNKKTRKNSRINIGS